MTLLTWTSKDPPSNHINNPKQLSNCTGPPLQHHEGDVLCFVFVNTYLIPFRSPQYADYLSWSVQRVYRFHVGVHMTDLLSSALILSVHNKTTTVWINRKKCNCHLLPRCVTSVMWWSGSWLLFLVWACLDTLFQNMSNKKSCFHDSVVSMLLFIHVSN